mmetsp:Transcript_28555/g.90991  ORF Transcript_28555/g.90991 Transcript_28555/m.90991 type:complete len:201 (-) Transcript_28555:1329-1931(-)
MAFEYCSTVCRATRNKAYRRSFFISSGKSSRICSRWLSVRQRRATLVRVVAIVVKTWEPPWRKCRLENIISSPRVRPPISTPPVPSITTPFSIMYMRSAGMPGRITASFDPYVSGCNTIVIATTKSFPQSRKQGTLCIHLACRCSHTSARRMGDIAARSCWLLWEGVLCRWNRKKSLSSIRRSEGSRFSSIKVLRESIIA